MWPFDKKKTTPLKPPVEKQFPWIPVGEGNPFNAPLMDIRDFSLSMTSTTSDQSIAENYSKSRQSNGEEFIGAEPAHSISIPCNIKYPHNGEDLDGVVYKSPQMEVKWDIYACGEWFYFVRSWTSDLIYKVRYQNSDGALKLNEIFTTKELAPEAEQVVHSIMLTHALGRVWPFPAPKHIDPREGKKIAMYMFANFGSKATLVTSGNTTNIQLVGKKA
jgi:hypothetical protein